MGDDWEEDDWDAAATSFKAQATIAPPTGKAAFGTKGQAILAGVAEPDTSKFANEDEEEEVKDHNIVKSQVGNCCFGKILPAATLRTCASSFAPYPFPPLWHSTHSLRRRRLRSTTRHRRKKRSP